MFTLKQREQTPNKWCYNPGYPGFFIAMINVICTVYNSSLYLHETLDSLRFQTFQDWEAIIWIDGATDNSYEIARRYEAIDKRFVVIKSPHQGRPVALKRAIESGKRPFIAILDSDDTLAPGALETLLPVLKNNPDIGCVYSDYNTMDKIGNITGLGSRCQIPYDVERLLTDFMTFHLQLFRRDLYHEVGGIDEALLLACDYDLFLKLSEVTTFLQIKLPLYNYRIHGGSLSQKYPQQQEIYSAHAIRNALTRRGRPEILSVQNGRFLLANNYADS